ncbi:MAG: polyprenyl synthetase family protein [Chloroflexi bacterium]|nr:polyprenyl synthetase family protein [Chloroflexota bacterium]
MPDLYASPDYLNVSALVDRVIEQTLPATSPAVAFWKELNSIFGRELQDHPADLGIRRLPALACAAVGGDPTLAEPVTAAWQLIRLAAKLLDDVEDFDVATEAPLMVNVATGLVSLAPLVLRELPTRLLQDMAHDINLELQRAIMRAAAGQHADLSGAQKESRTEDADTWLEIAVAKSGELLGWATWAGALVGGADAQAQGCLRAYGIHLGVALQMADDFHGIWGSPRVSDLAGHHLNLSVCYARSVLKNDSLEQLETLLSAARQRDKAAEIEARELLVNLGAQGYLLTAARVQQRQALAALDEAETKLKDPAPLAALLNRLMPSVESTEV